ncbi:acetyltransferase spyB [Aspergillus novofumigatus IBT 16806]|uniref:Wax synthase domain-containing protein n=1 Tax=Aspergillus novofumigatus (strain IBT 16806) TaxID=1392255 RepID=A0A2I1BXU4_ASPN1|nr:uncharacterized protein P174DRAFT_463660 [Aspergillus novofumigatus IBT 16806]PKX90203.1 hypothetical protein P174DRAFT_463660 [Aspergillus novofumigatus IBT 16806]
MYGRERRVLEALLYAIPFLLAQNLVPAIVVLRTEENSVPRYLWIFCFFTVIIQGFNLVLINPLDKNELLETKIIHPRDDFPRKTYKVARLFTYLRGVRTPWQVKGVPSHPAYLARQPKAPISRTAFLIRQAAIVAWLYLYLNCANYLADGNLSPLSKPICGLGYLRVSMEEWRTRIMISQMFWFAFLRAAVDIDYRTASILSVGIGLDAPEDWPPLFGRAKQAYTLRNFWGTYWHQMFRWPFTATSNYLARELMALPRPSLLERYTNIFFVFLVSGVMHVMSDLFMGISMSQSTSLVFFCSMADSHRPGRASTVDSDGCAVPCWRKLVGFIWVCIWLTLTTPVWLYSLQTIKEKSSFLVNIPELVGARTAIAMTVGGGLLVKCIFRGEL